MKVAIVNIPFEAPSLGENVWITAPPQGYGGIQWNCANLIDGLAELRHEIFMLGAPGSQWDNPAVRVIDCGTPESIKAWLQHHLVDVIHDFSNSVTPLWELSPPRAYVSTHHFTGTPKDPVNAIYVSDGQRRAAKAGDDAPVIRVPVNAARYRFRRNKQNYLLFLGRVSPWKGALEAAAFAKAAKMVLRIAGPTWEPEYAQIIRDAYADAVQFVGEVGGGVRLDLLSGATALVALSQPTPGPWGGIWSEPGATVVSEAAASGTPVIGSDNGCLAEIVPRVGRVLPSGATVSQEQALAILNSLPSPDEVRDVAVGEWSHVRIARQYEDVYKRTIGGARWR